MSSEDASIARVLLPSGDGSVELLRASYVTHRFSPHTHAEYAIGVVERGSIRTRSRVGTVQATEGQIIVLHPGEVHTGEAASAGGYAYRMLYVPVGVMTGYCRDLPCTSIGRSVTFRQPVIDDADAVLLLRRALDGLERNVSRWSEAVLRHGLRSLATRHGVARGAYAPLESGGALVRFVREYLDGRHARGVTLSELSTLTGRSASSINRTFRAAIGLPPYAYLELVRIQHARDLLSRGHSAVHVANEMGFADQSHFTKQFKRVVGVPPGQYAKGFVTKSGGRTQRI